MLRSLYPKAHRRYLSLPLLGSIADGFDDWLVSNGYTQLSRKGAISELRHVDAELRRRRIKEIPNLTRAVLHDCWRSLHPKVFPSCSNRAGPGTPSGGKRPNRSWPTRDSNFGYVEPDRSIREFSERSARTGSVHHFTPTSYSAVLSPTLG